MKEKNAFHTGEKPPCFFPVHFTISGYLTSVLKGVFAIPKIIASLTLVMKWTRNQYNICVAIDIIWRRFERCAFLSAKKCCITQESMFTAKKEKKTIQFMLSALCLTLKPMKTMSDILILRIIIIRKVKLVFILVECLKVIITIFTANVWKYGRSWRLIWFRILSCTQQNRG